MNDLRSQIPVDEYDERMDAAKEVAGWELGDPSWAYTIVGAFLNPEAALRVLEEERAS